MCAARYTRRGLYTEYVDDMRLELDPGALVPGVVNRDDPWAVVEAVHAALAPAVWPWAGMGASSRRSFDGWEPLGHTPAQSELRRLLQDRDCLAGTARRVHPGPCDDDHRPARPAGSRAGGPAASTLWRSPAGAPVSALEFEGLTGMAYRGSAAGSAVREAFLQRCTKTTKVCKGASWAATRSNRPPGPHRRCW
jgi:hypothetical protein